MPRRIDDDCNNVTWLSDKIENDFGVDCYSQCLFNEYRLNIGDFVHVSNPDQPSQLKQYDVVKITQFYEITDPLSLDYKYQAFVESYKRPSTIPEELIELIPDVDWKRELILNPVSYTTSLPLNSIRNRCSVMFCKPSETISDALANIKNARNYYVCRYKIVNTNGTLSLVAVDNLYIKKSSEATPKKRIVSPIKIVNKNSVQKVAKLSQYDIENIVSESDGDPDESTDNVLRSLDCHNNSFGARRNLNSSLNDAANGVLMGSIVGSPRTRRNDLKMTIKVTRNENLSENFNSATTPSKLTQHCTSELENISNRKSAMKRRQRPDSPIPTTPTKTPKSRIRSGSAKRNENGSSITDTPKGILKPLHIRLQRCTETQRRSISFDLEPRRVLRNKSVTPTKTTITTPVQLRRSRRSSTINQKYLNESVDDFNQLNGTDTSLDSAKSVDSDFGTPRRKSSKRSSQTTTKTPNKTPSKTSSQTPRKTPSKAAVITPNKTPKTSSQSVRRTPSTRVTTLEPIIDKRTSAINKDRSDAQLAKESLHVSSVPKSLPCRENEFNNVYSFIEGKILDGCGGCMYVSGVPGTGKTATITEVIRSLQLQVKRKKLPSFEFIEINGMRLTEPRQAYVQIYKQLQGKTIPWEQAQSLLEKRFKTPAMDRKTTVLLVDELDMLCNRRQDVVYNLLDWPTKKAAQLVVITIANTMDLPERLLMGRVTSRLGLTRLTFQPYSYKQLQEVVQARLTGTNIFNSDAVQLVARKVASMSGDCRRALDICRRATEIAEIDCGDTNDVMVSMSHVQTAFNEMITNPKVLAIKNCSKFEQLFLQAVEAEIARTGVDETNLFRVYQQYESICALSGVSIPDPGIALRISCKLGSSRLLICEHSSAAIHQKIMLNVSQDDIYYALHVKKDN